MSIQRERKRGGLRDKAVALAVLVAAAAIYQGIIAVWLRPPPMQVASTEGRKIEVRDNSLADLFDVNDWQRGRCWRLQTADGTLLFEHWEPTQGLGWKLWPVTIVLGRGLEPGGDRPDQPPILIDAPGGAQIEFNGSLDVFSGVAPSIRRGQMIGPVHLHRQPPANSTASHYRDAADRATGRDHTIDLRTANVGLDRTRIWTTEKIDLRLGQARFVGRDLTLHLAQGANLAAPPPTDPATAGGTATIRRSPLARTLDRLELVYLDEVVLPVGGQDGQSAGEVSLTCGGTTEFDFALDKLSLRDTIVLTHRQPENSPDAAKTPPSPFSGSSPFSGFGLPGADRLTCGSLDLTLRDPLSRTRTRQFASDWIDRIEASGRPMRIDAPSGGWTIVASGLTLDPVMGLARIETAAPDADHPNASIRVDRVIDGQEIHAELARLEYRFDPAAPGRLGTLEVVGGGHVAVRSADLPIDQFTWRQSLRATPAAGATTDSPEVPVEVAALGNVRVDLSDGGHFQTDALESLIVPVAGRPGQPTAWRPERLGASGNVDALAANMSLQTHRLRLFFDYLVDPQAAAPRPPVAAAGLTPPAVRQPSSPPIANGAFANDTAANDTGVPAGLPPSRFAAAEVSAQLTLAGAQMRSMDVSARGNVTADTTVQLASLPAPAPVRLSGQTLRLTRGTPRDVVQLTGDPGGKPIAGRDDPRSARIDVADGYLIGETIDVDLTANRMAIDSPGQIKMPTAMVAPPGGGRWREPPMLRFGDSMNFDGQTLRLLGGIDVAAQTTAPLIDDQLHVVGNDLAIELTGPMNFDQWLPPPGQSRGRPQPVAIDHATLSPRAGQRLAIDAFRTAADGLRLSISRLRTGPLRWTPGVATSPGQSSSASQLGGGQIVATGGGRYTGWFNSAGGPLPNLTSDTPGPSGGVRAADAMLESDAVKRPTAIDLVYQGNLSGEIFSRQLTIDGGVQMLQRSVGRLGDPIAVDRPGPLATGDVTLSCQQIGVAADPAAPPGQPAPWEVTAEGSVMLRSHSGETIFQVDAQRCGYSAAKELLTIAGGPTRPAHFSGLDTAGNSKGGVSANFLILDVRTMTIRDSQLRGVTVATPPELIRGRTR